MKFLNSNPHKVKKKPNEGVNNNPFESCNVHSMLTGLENAMPASLRLSEAECNERGEMQFLCRK